MHRMRAAATVILALIIMQFALAQSIPQEKAIPPPPTPSFGTSQSTNSQIQTTQVVQPVSESPPTAQSYTGGSPIPTPLPPPAELEIPGVINSSALDRVQSPQVQAPQAVQSNDDLRKRVTALENEIAVIKSELAALRAEQGQAGDDTVVYWQIIAIVGILVLISFLVKEGLSILKKRQVQESEVEGYIRQARSAGVPDEDIIRRLVSAGWDDSHLRRMMGKF